MRDVPFISKYRSAHYREHRYWSPLMGENAVRLSMPGGAEAARVHGPQAATMEYYAIVRAPEHGRLYREAREAALDAIWAAIMRGDPPGEVAVE